MIEKVEIASPCVGICNLSGDNVCRGCYRSLEEIQQWFSIGVEAKQTIMQNVERRKQKATSQD